MGIIIITVPFASQNSEMLYKPVLLFYMNPIPSHHSQASNCVVTVLLELPSSHFCLSLSSSRRVFWTWTWAKSRIWGGTGRPGMLQSMGSQRVRHDLVTEQQQQKSILRQTFNFMQICLFVVRLLSRVQLFCDPMDCSLSGSSVHGISQTRILEWVAISFTRGSSQLRDWTCVSCIGRWILYHWAAWDPSSRLSNSHFCPKLWHMA